MSIWFTNAAVVGNTTTWYQESLPIGNGKLAAVIYGGVGTEQVQFNEETIWTGQPHDYSHPGGAGFLSGMQTNIFNLTAGQTAFWNTCTSNFMSLPVRQPAYQPAGVLNLTFPHSGLANYRRELNLSNATVNVKYDFSGVSYSRDYFASAPSNNVIVIRLTANSSGKIAFTATFSTLQSGTSSTIGNDLVLHANVITNGDTRYYNTGCTNSIRYDARLRVVPEGGTVSTTSSSISVTNADAVTLLLAVASNFKNYNDVTADYVTICSNNVAAAAANTYATLRQAQQDDYQSLFNRVVLDLGVTAKAGQPIGARKRTITSGDDPSLTTLTFQLGRYLIISGSRPGSQPLNLQGKWNDVTVPSWDSKMTLNINEEMNYWGAELANLSECHLPLFDMISDLSVTGARCAKTNYNANGWVVHHNTDLWRAAAPINGQDGVWPTGGAWLCQHLWWHYQYTGDTNFLATIAYPLMKSSAQFFESFLIPHKTNANWLVTNPSYSPEHDLFNAAPNVAAPTMDNELLRDLFKHVIEATQILGVDAAFRTNITNIRNKLPPDKVGAGGYLQEWVEDYDDPGHRHCSHLVGLFPGDEISPYYTPTIAQAALVSVRNRGPGITGAGRIGWGQAWRLNLRNRLLDGDDAYLVMTNLIFDSTLSTNLIFSNGLNRQMDCIYGTLSGIGEMFLHSHSGELNLLPALPTAFTNGNVSGLCARGAFVVDIAWQSNKLASANILSKVGNTCRLRSKWPIDVKLGSNYVSAPMILPGLYEFTTLAGSNYTIVPSTAFETEFCPATISAGDTHQATTNAAFSNVRGTKLNANAPGDFVTYTLTNVTAGTYQLRVAADAGTDRARFQLSGGPGGTSTNIGPVCDTYSATNVVYLLPLHLNLATNFISLCTNMLKEFDCGTWTAPTNGNYDFKFTVVDKNASSTGYWLSFDYIKLTPAVVTVVQANPPTLKASLIAGQIVLSWPTNATGFALESATNLVGASWSNVLPAPVFFSTNNFVTNSADADRRFYRLRKP